MKKIKRLGVTLIGAFITIVSLNSCEKTYVEPTGSTTTTVESSKMLMAPATWRVSSFQWHDKSDNNTFVKYIFQFGTDGLITAIHNNIIEYGKWSIRNNIFQMEFNSNLLSELDNNWTILGHTANDIELRGLSPIDNSSEFLSLEKVSTDMVK